MRYFALATSWILLTMFSVTSCVAIERASRKLPAVPLRDTAWANGKKVRVSDLLPEDAPAALQKAAAEIELCQSPLPGSMRVLEAGQITNKLAGRPELLRQLAIPPRVTVRYSGWAIAEGEMRKTVSKFLCERWNADLPEATPLEWPPMLASAEKDSALQVMGASWDDRQQSIELRLRCARRAACGSFLVHVILPAALSEEWHNRIAPGNNPNLSGHVDSSLIASGAALAEKGKPATLILDSSNMRISVRVTCLQAGALNQEIRVFDARTRHVFHAEVVGAGLVHAAL